MWDEEDRKREKIRAEKFAQKQTEMFDNYKIPEELRCWLGHVAWEQGHACGFDEVLNVLSDILDLAPDAIEKYTNRILSEKK